MSRRARVLAACLATSLAAGCAGHAPVVPSPSPNAFDAAAAVAAVHGAGRADESELDVQPLRDPQVEDLRRRAATLHARGDHAAAAAALDQALAISPEDPAVLQERAEAALWLHDAGAAARFARRAAHLGTQVGPMCRRHWETVAQAALAEGGEAVAADARRQRDACTVAPPPRY